MENAQKLMMQHLLIVATNILLKPVYLYQYSSPVTLLAQLVGPLEIVRTLQVS